MTVILTTTSSILAIACLAWAGRKLLRVALCPICLGVAGTWLWMVVARISGLSVDPSMLAILLGGSVVGVAYQLEKRLPKGRPPLLWKTLFIPVGFVAAYGLAIPHWSLLAVTAVVLLFLAAAFFLPARASEKPGAAVEELEKQMKECC